MSTLIEELGLLFVLVGFCFYICWRFLQLKDEAEEKYEKLLKEKVASQVPLRVNHCVKCKKSHATNELVKFCPHCGNRYKKA